MQRIAIFVPNHKKSVHEDFARNFIFVSAGNFIGSDKRFAKHGKSGRKVLSGQGV
jgi:hypothetical protein